MNLETFEEVSAAIGARDLAIRDLSQQVLALDAARERQVELMEKLTSNLETVLARLSALEARPHYVPYPVQVLTPYTPIVWSSGPDAWNPPPGNPAKFDA